MRSVFHLLAKLRRKKLAKQRQEALQAFRAAVRRGDTRGQHAAFPAAFRATNEELRAAIGWRGLR